MTISSLFELIAASIGVVGSLFFAIGVLRQSTEKMKLLSYTYTNSNPQMRLALAMQKADYIFGGGLIFLAFVLQLLSFFFTGNTQILDKQQARFAPLIALILTIFISPILLWLSVKLAKHFKKQIEKQIKESSEEKT